MPLSRRQLIHRLGVGLALAPLSHWARAQSLDTARVMTGFPPGGTSDIICRRVAEKLQPGYARTVVVDNKPGAGGQIAVALMKGAPNDGSLMLQTPMSMLGVYPHVYKKLNYDPLTDVLPVSMLASFDFGFAVGPAVPASVKTLPEFLDWCKANPAQATFGSPGAGSVPHFIGVLLGRTAGVNLTHVPFRGSQLGIQDMIGGQIPAISAPLGEFLQHLPGGRARLLGASGAQRSRFAPQVPTYVEQGLRDMAFREWFGMYLPAGASAATINRLNAALAIALAASETVEGLAKMGLEPAHSTPGELAAVLKADTERWGPVVKAVGFTAES